MSVQHNIKLVESFFKGGTGLTAVPLKNYTSGDKSSGSTGLEGLVDELILQAARDSGIDMGRVKVNGDYFNPPDVEEQDPQRMDHHVWVDDKCVIVMESRAWIDKPFMTLKRAVVRNFMELDYVRNKLSEDVKFLFVALAIDIKPRLVNTLDKTMGYGDRIGYFKFSPKRRNYRKNNYFDNGINYADIESLYSTIYDIFVDNKKGSVS